MREDRHPVPVSGPSGERRARAGGPDVEPGAVLELEAGEIAFGGRAVARVNGFVLFIEGALPGERVRARIERVRRDHGFARVEDVLTPSPERVDPPCPVFGACGGCAFLHASYSVQRAAKTRWIRDALRRFPAAAESVPEIEPPADTLHFRNRMGFAIVPGPGDECVIGLHGKADPGRIVSAADCLLPPPPLMALLRALADALRNRRLRPRRADLRISRHTGQRMADLHADRPLPYHDELAEALRSTCEHLFVTVGPDGPGHRVRRKRTCLFGDGILVEHMNGLAFEIGPDTFFQTHTAEAERLARHVQELAHRAGARRVLDLYAGTGALALHLAAPGRDVVALEASAPSVEAARRNLARNRIERVRILRSSVEAVQPGQLDFDPDLVLVDPPRDGLSPAARNAVVRLAAPRLVYVSCNPSTLARDLSALATGGYEPESARGFDLFPQTPHVEAVVVLTRASPVP